MAVDVELIYCAGGNKRFAKIAKNYEFIYGARLPNKVYFHPDFVDQDWKNPDFTRYEAALAEHRPKLASVLDLERWEQLPEVLEWSKMASKHISDAVIIVPKLVGVINSLPTEVGGIPIRLAFSWPTEYGGAAWEILYEMVGWPHGVHVLGGSPICAFLLSHGFLKLPYRRAYQDPFLQGLKVVSADGNMCMKMATEHNAFFDPLKKTNKGYWATLKGMDGKEWGDGSGLSDAPYEAFRRSCKAIMAMWKGDLPKGIYS